MDTFCLSITFLVNSHVIKHNFKTGQTYHRFLLRRDHAVGVPVLLISLVECIQYVMTSRQWRERKHCHLLSIVQTWPSL